MDCELRNAIINSKNIDSVKYCIKIWGISSVYLGKTEYTHRGNRSFQKLCLHDAILYGGKYSKELVKILLRYGALPWVKQQKFAGIVQYLNPEEHFLTPYEWAIYLGNRKDVANFLYRVACLIPEPYCKKWWSKNCKEVVRIASLNGAGDKDLLINCLRHWHTISC